MPIVCQEPLEDADDETSPYASRPSGKLHLPTNGTPDIRAESNGAPSPHAIHSP